VNRQWQSGLMQSVDSRGRGFAQKYGYFEIRAKFPAGASVWPAFWLATQRNFVDPTSMRGEIDVVEAYGDQPGWLHCAVHIRVHGDRHWHLSKQFHVGNMTEEFHRYGVLVTSVWVIFYYDSEELYRFPTLDQYRTPLYLLVDLAMRKETIDEASSPSDMLIDYIRVYSM
jgi:beta-glucanase (GH16 family)